MPGLVRVSLTWIAGSVRRWLNGVTAMARSNLPLLFVYGTLIGDSDHPIARLLAANGRRIARGSIAGRLYIVPDPTDATNSYPGAMPCGNPQERVHGEVHEITGDRAALFAKLDHYEVCSPDFPEPHEFLRRRVSVELETGGSLKAMCYLYTWDVSRARHIASGRYVDVLERVG